MILSHRFTIKTKIKQFFKKKCSFQLTWIILNNPEASAEQIKSVCHKLTIVPNIKHIRAQLTILNAHSNWNYYRQPSLLLSNIHTEFTIKFKQGLGNRKKFTTDWDGKFTKKSLRNMVSESDLLVINYSINVIISTVYAGTSYQDPYKPYFEKCQNLTLLSLYIFHQLL